MPNLNSPAPSSISSVLFLAEEEEEEGDGDLDGMDSVEALDEVSERGDQPWRPTDDLLDAILEDPRKHFAEFLYESNVLETFELLNALISHAPRDGEGHTAAIECLWCWQDLMESANPDAEMEKCPFGLSPIVDELRLATRLEVVCAALRLLVALCRQAPNHVSRIRIRHELNELRMDELIGRLKEQFDRNPELCSLIAEWMRTRNDNNTDRHSVANTELELTQPTGEEADGRDGAAGDKKANGRRSNRKGKKQFSCRCGGVRADADSGTFSGLDDDDEDKEEDEEVKTMSSGRTEDGDEDDDATTSSSFASAGRRPTDKKILPELAGLIDCLCSAPFDAQAGALADALVGLLRQLPAGGASPAEFARRLQRLHISESNAPTPALVPMKLPAAPPPPPPPPGGGPPPLRGPPPPPPSASAPKLPFKLGAVNSKVGGVEIPAALRPKRVPPDGKKFRHLQWTKVPPRLAAAPMAGEGPTDRPVISVWQRMDSVDSSLCDKLDFSSLDVHFACVEAPVASTAASAGNDSAANECGAAATPAAAEASAPSPQSKAPPVLLISEKRSLSLNIFLRSCREADALVDALARSDADVIGAERLRMLVPLLPTDEEQKTLRHYSGDATALGQAEKFLLALMRIPDFKLRVEAMTLCLEFDALMTDVEPGLATLLNACNELTSSVCLQRVLYVLLHAGNYLNHGAAVGNAVGFRLSSLWKVNELRAVPSAAAGGDLTKTARTLLHFVAEQLNNCADEFEAELGHAAEAAKLSFEALRTDLSGLAQRVGRLDAPLRDKSDDLFFADFKNFITAAKERLAATTRRLAEIEERRVALAAYFCEEPKTFSMEECFKIFGAFLNAFRRACMDNGAAPAQSTAVSGGMPTTQLLLTPVTQSTVGQRKASAPPTLRIAAPSVEEAAADSGAIAAQPPPSPPSQLSGFFLNGDLSSTPRSKTARHSIHATPRADAGLSSIGSDKTRRTSLILPERDSRDRQREMSLMLSANQSNDVSSSGGVVRRRTSLSGGRTDGSEEAGDASPPMGRARERSATSRSSRLATIRDEEAALAGSSSGKNSLESFVDQALEINAVRSPSAGVNAYTGRRYSTAVDNIEAKDFVAKTTSSKSSDQVEAYAMSKNDVTITSTEQEPMEPTTRTSISRDDDNPKNILTIPIGSTFPAISSFSSSAVTPAMASVKNRATSIDAETTSVSSFSQRSGVISQKASQSSSKLITRSSSAKSDDKTLNRVSSARSSIRRSAEAVRSSATATVPRRPSTLLKSKPRDEPITSTALKPALYSTAKKPDATMPVSPTKTSAARRANLYRVRARQSMTDEEPPTTPSATITKPLRQSDIRLSQKRVVETISTVSPSSPINRTSALSSASTTLRPALSRSKLSSNSLLGDTGAVGAQPTIRSVTNRLYGTSSTVSNRTPITSTTTTRETIPPIVMRTTFSKTAITSARTSTTTTPTAPTRSFPTSTIRGTTNGASILGNPMFNRSTAVVGPMTSVRNSTTPKTLTRSFSTTSRDNTVTTHMNKRQLSGIFGTTMTPTASSATARSLATIKPADSVSTGARPALIKTGSVSSDSGKPSRVLITATTTRREEPTTNMRPTASTKRPIGVRP